MCEEFALRFPFSLVPAFRLWRLGAAVSQAE